MVRAVIFDLDDTLYDAKEAYEKGLQALCRLSMERYGLTEDGFNDLHEKAKKTVKARLDDVAASHNRLLYEQAFLELLGRKPAGDALLLYETYWGGALNHMMLFPYVQPLLEALRDRQIVIGILSDLTAHIQHRKIHRLGLVEYLDVLVTSEEAGEEKPSKAAYGLLIKKLEKFGIAPEEALMVGDSQERDVDGAVFAGLQGLLFRREEQESMGERILRMI